MNKFFIVLAAAGFMTACNNPQATETAATQEVAQDSTGANYVVDATSSILNWEATKKVGAHNGTVNVNSGNFNIKDGNIVSGGFSIDMMTIKNSDITDAEMNGKLVGHLKSPDFFNVEGFPTGKFEITSSEVLSNDPAGFTHKISGNLTIKDSSHNVSFPVKVAINGDNLDATGEVVINRLQWGIVYNSVSVSPADLLKKLGDNAINDEVKINVTLKAKKG
ncbi:MAG: YceI family protein [Bacteroidia bacterium]|nr:YceI family protein [Bacteroidia bacterium]